MEKRNKNKYDGINFLIFKSGKSAIQIEEELTRLLKLIEEGIGKNVKPHTKSTSQKYHKH